jgi:hypothetical protein
MAKTAHLPDVTRPQKSYKIPVLQELNVIGTMSIAENIFLHWLPQRGGFLRIAELHKQAHKALERVGLGDVNPATPAGLLGMTAFWSCRIPTSGPISRPMSGHRKKITQAAFRSHLDREYNILSNET